MYPYFIATPITLIINFLIMRKLISIQIKNYSCGLDSDILVFFVFVLFLSLIPILGLLTVPILVLILIYSLSEDMFASKQRNLLKKIFFIKG